MPAIEPPPRRKLPNTFQAVLAACVLLVFLLFHLVAGGIMQRAALRDGGDAKPAQPFQDVD